MDTWVSVRIHADISPCDMHVCAHSVNSPVVLAVSHIEDMMTCELCLI